MSFTLSPQSHHTLESLLFIGVSLNEQLPTQCFIPYVFQVIALLCYGWC
jgi:hypothetical protein